MSRPFKLVHDFLHLVFEVVFGVDFRLLLRRNNLSTIILVLLVAKTNRVSIGIRRRGEGSNGGPPIFRIRKERLLLILVVVLISVAIRGRGARLNVNLRVMVVLG